MEYLHVVIECWTICLHLRVARWVELETAYFNQLGATTSAHIISPPITSRHVSSLMPSVMPTTS
ncbi:hypothetical protein Syun_003662 [Stephania yunnanensis]|uniref:Uncharacterized protein n=1 Tax=Stephania yunnanensis TaxID=152371 RepID=A0AAP0Q0S8_9MAGN